MKGADKDALVGKNGVIDLPNVLVLGTRKGMSPVAETYVLPRSDVRSDKWLADKNPHKIKEFYKLVGRAYNTNLADVPGQRPSMYFANYCETMGIVQGCSRSLSDVLKRKNVLIADSSEMEYCSYLWRRVVEGNEAAQIKIVPAKFATVHQELQNKTNISVLQAAVESIIQKNR